MRERADPPPKEQPPWNLSGTRDRKGDDSLESEDERGTPRNSSTDGVGEARQDKGARPRNLSGPHDRQGHGGKGVGLLPRSGDTVNPDPRVMT